MFPHHSSQQLNCHKTLTHTGACQQCNQLGWKHSVGHWQCYFCSFWNRSSSFQFCVTQNYSDSLVSIPAKSLWSWQKFDYLIIINSPNFPPFYQDLGSTVSSLYGNVQTFQSIQTYTYFWVIVRNPLARSSPRACFCVIIYLFGDMLRSMALTIFCFIVCGISCGTISVVWVICLSQY